MLYLSDVFEFRSLLVALGSRSDRSVVHPSLVGGIGEGGDGARAWVMTFSFDLAGYSYEVGHGYFGNCFECFLLDGPMRN